MTQEEKDSVTIGEIRKVLLERLDRDIDTLVKLIKQGKHQLHHAEQQLKETVTDTLADLEKLDSWAGLPHLIKALTTHDAEGEK